MSARAISAGIVIVIRSISAKANGNRPVGTPLRMCYAVVMPATRPQLATDKAAALPAEAQEQVGREMLEPIDALGQLRAEISVGIAELDAGRGKQIDIEDVIKQARAEHAGS